MGVRTKVPRSGASLYGRRRRMEMGIVAERTLPEEEPKERVDGDDDDEGDGMATARRARY